MVMMANTNNRQLAKNWEPTVPPTFHKKSMAFSVGDTQWTPERKEWLRSYYSTTENWQLAARMNTFEGDIVRIAKSMHLQKSADFKRWEHYGNVKQEGAPFGYHWETDEEMLIRKERERQEDMERSKRVANSFSFCTVSEKQYLADVLLSAIQWARNTQPLTRDMGDW